MSDILSLKQKIVEALTKAVGELQKQGRLPQLELPEIILEHPQNPAHGDYAASLPLKLARAAKKIPFDFAYELVNLMGNIPEIVQITVAPPGFINFRLDDSWLARQVSEILAAGDNYGKIDVGRGRRVQLEFVSVNPTGPLHVGHGRGAILGSTLANLLTVAGYIVEKEYYVNDAGSQIDNFTHSLYARYQQVLNKPTDIPDDGYLGSYMVELAQEVVSEFGDKYLEGEKELGELGLDRMIATIKADLEMVDVTFDAWFRERSLFENGQYAKVMALLKDGGHITESEGAIWFTTAAPGEDKDNVLVRSDGTPTYFASDIAYHYNKFLERNFDRVINIWGADHQGHVSRLKAAVEALGVSPEKLEVIISQMVTLRRGGELVRVSKRSGDLITLREVVEEVGADACRFFFLARSADSQMDFDLELAKKESAENPVYYVQYAHARIASILRLAREKGLDWEGGDVSLLTAEPELALIRKMLLLPELVELVAVTLEPHHLAYYAQDLATAFHAFYRDCRVISDNPALTAARLKLVEAARLVLARTLHFMGMTAPEKM